MAAARLSLSVKGGHPSHQLLLGVTERALQEIQLLARRLGSPGRHPGSRAAALPPEVPSVWGSGACHTVRRQVLTCTGSPKQTMGQGHESGWLMWGMPQEAEVRESEKTRHWRKESQGSRGSVPWGPRGTRTTRPRTVLLEDRGVRSIFPLSLASCSPPETCLSGPVSSSVPPLQAAVWPSRVWRKRKTRRGRALGGTRADAGDCPSELLGIPRGFRAGGPGLGLPPAPTTVPVPLASPGSLREGPARLCTWRPTPGLPHLLKWTWIP